MNIFLADNFDYDECGKLIYHKLLSNDARDFLMKRGLDPDELISYSREHDVIELTFEDKVYANGKPAFGTCGSYPSASNHHDSKTYKITLQSEIDLELKKIEVKRVKEEAGIEINGDLYYWLFFHELGHTFKATKSHHAGVKVTEETQMDVFKDKQEEDAKKYGANLFINWKRQKMKKLEYIN